MQLYSTATLKDLETWSPWQIIGLLSKSADEISSAIPTWGRSTDCSKVKQLCERHIMLTQALSASVNENASKWKG